MKSKVLYGIFLFFCILISFSIYKTVEARWYDWALGGTKTVEVVFVPETRTLDSEIDRLSTKYVVDPKIIRAIITCESQMYGEAINRNRLPDGTIWSSDFGPLQINDYYHEQTMKNLGLDIHNQYDSLEYGFMLFKSQGVEPWSASKGCWSKIIN